jgi:hypothetical protein
MNVHRTPPTRGPHAAILLLGLAVALSPSARGQTTMPTGPSWGRTTFQPQGANPLFATADGCALCHSASEDAVALKNALGDDISPHGLWQGTMMANSFRDPYWRAQVSRETAAAPNLAAEIEALCVRCHAPAAHHFAKLSGEPLARLAGGAADALTADGVTCTVCHQAQPDNLGKPESFAGLLEIKPGRVIFGPYENPVPGPMRMHAAYTPTFGTHISKSALCGSCHTLTTHAAPGAAPFHEQSPYLEWRNSVFNDENGRGAESRTCQECHMPDQGSSRIAHNPRGLDFNIEPRPNVRAHAFVGGNAYMLDLLRTNREELGVTASDSSLRRAAAATRRQLGDSTATIAIKAIARRGRELDFDVEVTNLCGHKFPTGYPARRAWLMIDVRAGRDTVFTSGGFDGDGRIAGLEDELAQPHFDVVRTPGQVQIYEMRAVDLEGKPTTSIVGMAKAVKDNRLLPRGWKKDGPHAAEAMPAGLGEDADFAGGTDTVHYRLTLPDNAGEALTIVARLLYQTIPPAWAAPLRAVDTEEAKRFVRLYDAQTPRPETVALAVEQSAP